MSNDSSSGSEIEDEEPLVVRKSNVLNSIRKKILSSALEDTEKAVDQERYETAHESGEEDARGQEIKENGDEVNEPVDLVYLNRNSTSTRSQERKNTDLLDSAEVKDLEWTQRCLQNNASPDATCQQLKLSVAHIAAFFGDSSILNEIITAKLDLVKRSDAFGRTALHFASWEGNLDCIAILLGLQPGVFNQNTKEKKIQKRNEKVREIDIIPEKYEVLNTTVGCELKKYENLCDSGHSCSSVSTILEVVWTGCTALHIACARLHRETVLALLACGAKITTLDSQGRTPLDVTGLQKFEAGKLAESKSKDFIRIVEGIIRYGKHHSVDRSTWLSNQNGTSPLHIAILLDTKRGSNLLLDVGADLGIVDERGETPLHLAVILRRQDILKKLSSAAKTQTGNHINKINQNEYSPLHLAILEQWTEGVAILLDGSASPIDSWNKNKDTALHFAARVGYLDIIELIIKKLGGAKEKWIDSKNALNETSLFVAIKNSNAQCVRCLIHEGSSTEMLLEGFTVVHKAIESNNPEILNSLLQIEKVSNLMNIMDDKLKMTPLHYAALKGKADYVQKLIYKGAELSVQTEDGNTPMHVAAKYGNSEVIKVILTNDPHDNLTEIRDQRGWLPFHTAAMFCQRDCIDLFLENGSNLSEVVQVREEKKKQIINIIINNMPRSAEYLGSVFDKNIKTNDFSLDQPDCEVTFDYSVIIPNRRHVECEKSNENLTNMDNEHTFSQMKSISALFSSGSNFEIQKLILHPFIESFLFLKWNILKYFFFLILGIYVVFVILLTDITVNMYDDKYRDLSTPRVLLVKEVILVFNMIAILILEFLFMRIKGVVYFKRVEGWVKPISVIMAFMVITNDMAPYELGGARFISAVALLMSWVEITILLSRFPEFGYYFQMFSTVALRVVKVLALFGCFLIIGFSLIFWILIRKNESFISPWDSLMKTIVMMTSEFDYGSMVEEESEPDQIAVQLFFIIFLICVPIVLMNLLLALAVSDVKDLETEGKIQRLSEQVEFLGNLEVLARKIFTNKLTFNRKWKVDKKVVIYPGKPFWDPDNKRFPRTIIESVCSYLHDRKESEDRDLLMNELLKKIEENRSIIDQLLDLKREHHKEISDMIKQLTDAMQSQQSNEQTKSGWRNVLKF